MMADRGEANLVAPDVALDELRQNAPAALDGVFPDFDWDVRQLWSLRLPVEELPVAEFRWLLQLPLWRWGGRRFVLRPAEVLCDPEQYLAHAPEPGRGTVSTSCAPPEGRRQGGGRCGGRWP